MNVISIPTTIITITIAETTITNEPTFFVSVYSRVDHIAKPCSILCSRCRVRMTDKTAVALHLRVARLWHNWISDPTGMGQVTRTPRQGPLIRFRLITAKVLLPLHNSVLLFLFLILLVVVIVFLRSAQVAVESIDRAHRCLCRHQQLTTGQLTTGQYMTTTIPTGDPRLPFFSSAIHSSLRAGRLREMVPTVSHILFVV